VLNVEVNNSALHRDKILTEFALFSDLCEMGCVKGLGPCLWGHNTLKTELSTSPLTFFLNDTILNTSKWLLVFRVDIHTIMYTSKWLLVFRVDIPMVKNRAVRNVSKVLKPIFF